MLDADGLGIGVTCSGALRPGLLFRDERPRFDEEIAGCRDGIGHGHGAFELRAASARAMSSE